MTTMILKGTIVSAAAAGAPEITEGGYLVAEDGVITGTMNYFVKGVVVA